MRPLIALNALLLACVVLVAPPADAAPPTCFGVRATIVGDDRGEVIDGTPGRDVIVGLGGDDVIRGRGGNDLVCGGRGADKLYGGPGDDRLSGGLDRVSTNDEGSLERIGDTLRGGPGDDRMVGGRDTRAAADIARDAISWDQSARAVSIDLTRGTATGEGHDSFEPRWTDVVASTHDDTVLGSARADRIFAGRGNDTVRSGAGADRIYGDDSDGDRGADVIAAGAGNDTVESMGGTDHVTGGPDDDQLYDFGRGPDVLQGGDGDDVIGDEMSISAGRLAGGPGRDRVILFSEHLNPDAHPATGSMDMATGSVHTDAGAPASFPATGFEWVTLNTYGYVWTITGTPGADEVGAAGSHGTTFHGLGGDDRFMGSAYDDTFDGGDGTDRNLGMGVGTNTCISVEVHDDASCGP